MDILIPILAVTGIGLACGIMLVIVSKFMAVPEDEKFTKIRECLPGANCGACGYAGCDGYAHALANGEITETSRCVPGASAVAKAVAEAMGQETQETVAKVAFVGCGGNTAHAAKRYDYQGIASCTAAKLLFSGDSMCTYGCLGYGDCANVCPQHAITITDGLAKADPDLCIGCGLCAKACPNHLLQVVPSTVQVVVRCSNHDKGAVTRKSCSAGCIGCKKCERECEAGAITVVDNCAVIDYSKCTGCGHCAEICTTGCIQPVNFSKREP